MAVQKQLGTWMLLLACATAQNAAGPATLQSVTTARQGADLRVEVILSGPVQPSFDTASNPDRILLDLPDTRSNDAVKTVPVHVNGVLRVRAGQHSTSPLVTRVVLDLDQTHPYTVTTEGNKIVVTISAVERARKATQGAPVAATSGNLIGVFRRRHDTAVPLPEQTTADFPTPFPPASTAGPAFEPASNNSSVAAVPTTPLTAPQSQSQPASGSTASAAGMETSGAAQTSFEQKPVATAVPPPVAPSSSSASAATPTPDVAAPVEPVAVPVTAKNEEPAALAASAPAISPSPSPETSTVIARSDDPSLRTVFKVKYVAEGVAYLEGGRAQGLNEGMKLEVEDTNLPATQGDSANAADPRVVAELEVSGVAETSAVTDIHSPKRPVKAGDLAYLSNGDAEALVQQRALSATRQYPAVISFTEGDTLDEEAREEVPRPPLPSVNRARGRIGFDDIETISHGTSSSPAPT